MLLFFMHFKAKAAMSSSVLSNGPRCTGREAKANQRKATELMHLRFSLTRFTVCRLVSIEVSLIHVVCSFILSGFIKKLLQIHLISLPQFDTTGCGLFIILRSVFLIQFSI